ncbi:MAG: hypothetical protein IJV00_03250 [Clostridia bacterium]|nr:hypothetical protein [Clostridia bacterium]
MEIRTQIKNWRLGFCRHRTVEEKKLSPKSEREAFGTPIRVIDAEVPGNYELDLSRAGILPEDLYFGDNVWETQKYEDLHLWYFAKFIYRKDENETYLLFDGIDTAAEIFVDGELLGTAENMLIPHEYPLGDLGDGEHELTVHVIPAAVYSLEHAPDALAVAQTYSRDSLVIRKAPYLYGWDIMPRTVSGGLWREVLVVKKPRERIVDVSFCVSDLTPENASVKVTVDTRLLFDGEYRLKASLTNRDGRIEASTKLFSASVSLRMNVPCPRLWQPKNYGDPELYGLEVSLERNGEEIDRLSKRVGIRTVVLDRTSRSGDGARFRFFVNGKPVYAMGTNWVPTDAFPSRHEALTERGLVLAEDLGCNMIRCWGGNVYNPDSFYDFCDAHGIMVWQDFSMACGIYPQDGRFCSLMREEAESVVKRLRDHPSIVLWSGDNECDQSWRSKKQKVNGENVFTLTADDNVITRKVLPEVIKRLDPSRPYLPSSPYLDGESIIKNDPSEDHLWGPRKWFKGEYYKDSKCCFASETGYHGCPSPESLKKFIGKDHLENMGDAAVCSDPHWLAHSASPESDPKAPFAYRVPLMIRQVERLFGSAKKDLELFALQSQISQAEALKFFIEHFRAAKPYRSGLLWWNVIDGWPQVSDAVVDWYGTKKLAYSYIKRSQTPFAVIIDEPDENSRLALVADNETPKTVSVKVKVTEVLSGKEVFCGGVEAEPRETVRFGSIEDVKGYYLIRWEGDENGVNHFAARLGEDTDYAEYRRFLSLTGFDGALEGFEK